MLSAAQVCEWLEQVQMLDQLINAKIAERDSLLDMATNIVPQYSDMPHAGGVSDKVGNAAIRLATLAEETDELVDRYIDQRQRAIAALEQLPAKQYTVLHRHYIEYKTYESIAEEMCYSERQIYRHRDKGIELLRGIIKWH